MHIHAFRHMGTRWGTNHAYIARCDVTRAIYMVSYIRLVASAIAEQQLHGPVSTAWLRTTAVAWKPRSLRCKADSHRPTTTRRNLRRVGRCGRPASVTRARCDAVTQVVFPDIEAGFHDAAGVRRIMVYVIRNYHRLAADADADSSADFRRTLRGLAFVERAGTMMPADRFYDPADDLLRRMFVVQDFFPSSPFSDAAALSVLRELGLRTVDQVGNHRAKQEAFEKCWAHSPLRAAARRCPQQQQQRRRRQRQRVTEGTAMAP